MDDDNPYAAPQAELDEPDPAAKDDPRIRRHEKTLRIPVDAEPPLRCVSCNRPASRTLKVIIAGPDPNPKPDYRWHAVAAVAIAFLILAGACAGIDLPIDLFDFPPWILPLVTVGILAAFMAAQWRRNQTRKFYTCLGHYCVSRYSSLLSYLIFAVAIAYQFYMTIPDMDGAWIREVKNEYLFLFFGIIFASSWIPFWCRLNISGKQVDADTHELQGFGKKYLESFPKSDDT